MVVIITTMQQLVANYNTREQSKSPLQQEYRDLTFKTMGWQDDKDYNWYRSVISADWLRKFDEFRDQPNGR